MGEEIPVFCDTKLDYLSMADDEKLTRDPEYPPPAVDAILCKVLG